MPKTSSAPLTQSALVVAFSVEGDGPNGVRLQQFAFGAFPCKFLGHVYLQGLPPSERSNAGESRGEVAERLKAAVC